LRDTLLFVFEHAEDNDTFNTLMALQAYKLLNEQHCLQQQSSISHYKQDEIDLTIVPTSTCIGHSTKYRFAYRVRIENRGSTVQLLGRTWHLEAREQVVTTVNAPNTGVVGKLPVLHAGQGFEYISGCEGEGTMKGVFHFARVPDDTPSAVVGMPLPSGKVFQVPIATFLLRPGSPILSERVSFVAP
jgi:uncharacterized protein affecting Mg2+/Co2+ transport